MRHLLPEWHPQWGVLIAWPHPDTDWNSILESAEETFTALALTILDYENLLILCRDEAHEQHVRKLLSDADARQDRLFTHIHPYNDTWARDFGPITVKQDEQLLLLDFEFNGWGNKFAADGDNAATGALSNRWHVAVEHVPMVLEGGAIDTDGRGNLLTTSHCLLNPNRNPQWDKATIEEKLKTMLGIERIWWLNSGHLEGDDTDAHVDTLARFCNSRTIAYVQCTDQRDSHYPALAAMEQSLYRLASEHQLDLVPLPMTPPIYDENGHRLPATYANFLIINGAVLVPVYGCDTDESALSQLSQAMPDHDIIGIPCRPLIHQHGSLHCVTMQLPEGVIL